MPIKFTTTQPSQSGSKASTATTSTENATTSLPTLSSMFVKKEAPKQQVVLFKGFVGARGFLTKKGFKGMKLEVSWSKHLLESFRTDDMELYEIALESSLLDLDCRVVGGDNGAPLSIGDQGLYSGNQFETQVDILQKKEREHIARAGVFISEYEWSIVDANLRRLGQFSKPRFATLYPGETWACLAVADNAFLVANALVGRGVDPLLENSAGKDLFDAVKQQYAEVATRLRDLRQEKEAAAQQLVLPTEAEAMAKKEAAVVETLTNLHTFCTSLKDTYQQRLKVIETDKIDIRRSDRSGVSVDPQKRWNAALHPKVVIRIQECDELRGYIKERLHVTHKKNRELAKKMDFTKAILHEAEELKQRQQQEQERLVIGMNEDGEMDDDDDGPMEDDYFPDESGMGSLEVRDGGESLSSAPYFPPTLSLSTPLSMQAGNKAVRSTLRMSSRSASVRSTSSTDSDVPPALDSHAHSWLSTSAPKLTKKLSWSESVLEANLHPSLSLSGSVSVSGSGSGSGSGGAKAGGLAPALGLLSQTDDSLVMYK